MSFDWVSFLDANQIFYATSGPNVSRGHVAVHCPFCGSADPSQHMSINLEGKGWRCFRNRDQHVGKSPVYLVQALLNTTPDRARQIVGDAVFIPDDFMGAVLSKLDPERDAKPTRSKLRLPAEFKPIVDKPSARHFIDYLAGRGFTHKQIMRLTDLYDMRYAVRGPMRGRVIFPVRFEGKLVTWTGRTIYASEELRYRTLSADPEIEEFPALGPINDYLLWYDDLVANVDGCDTLVLCEGPFDALKVSVLGARHGITATCFFTASPSIRQIDLLYDVGGAFARRFLLLDRGTLGTALRVQGGLSMLDMHVLSLPSNVKDPGLLDEKGLLQIFP